MYFCTLTVGKNGIPQLLEQVRKGVTANRIFRANSVDPDQTPQNAASDQGLHGLSPVHRFININGQCNGPV